MMIGSSAVVAFAREFAVHAAIAEHFGYKLSIHSGSDKFSVFPIIGAGTAGRVHVKTAGTNWLEALRVVARVDAAFFRELHAWARAHFAEATRLIHVNTNPHNAATLIQYHDRQAVVCNPPPLPISSAPEAIWLLGFAGVAQWVRRTRMPVM